MRFIPGGGDLESADSGPSCKEKKVMLGIDASGAKVERERVRMSAWTMEPDQASPTFKNWSAPGVPCAAASRMRLLQCATKSGETER